MADDDNTVAPDATGDSVAETGPTTDIAETPDSVDAGVGPGADLDVDDAATDPAPGVDAEPTRAAAEPAEVVAEPAEVVAEPAEAVAEPAPKPARSRAAKSKDEAPADTSAAPEDEGPSARAPRGARAKKAPSPARAKTASERGVYVRTPAAPSEQGPRKERRGVVTSDKGEKSITVRVDEMKRHRKYKKIMRRSIKLNAHDELNEAKIGDVVRIVETRPLSRTKRWRLVEIVEVAK